MLKVKGYVHESIKFDGIVRRAHRTFNRCHAFDAGSLHDWENGLPIDKAEALIRRWNAFESRTKNENRYYLDLDGVEEVVTHTEAK